MSDPSSLYCWVLVQSCMKSWKEKNEHFIDSFKKTTFKKKIHWPLKRNTIYVDVDLLEGGHVLVLLVVDPLLDLRDVHRLLDYLEKK